MIILSNIFVTRFPFNAGIHMQLLFDFLPIKIFSDSNIICARSSSGRSSFSHNRVILLEERCIPKSPFGGIYSGRSVADAYGGIRINHFNTLNKQKFTRSAIWFPRIQLGLKSSDES